MSIATTRRQGWISRAEGRRRLACGAGAFSRLVAEGHLTVRKLPVGAARLLVLEDDVNRLAAVSTTPRRVQPAT